MGENHVSQLPFNIQPNCNYFAVRRRSFGCGSHLYVPRDLGRRGLECLRAAPEALCPGSPTPSLGRAGAFTRLLREPMSEHLLFLTLPHSNRDGTSTDFDVRDGSRTDALLAASAYRQAGSGFGA